jgi:hypothetical protein
MQVVGETLVLEDTSTGTVTKQTGQKFIQRGDTKRVKSHFVCKRGGPGHATVAVLSS